MSTGADPARLGARRRRGLRGARSPAAGVLAAVLGLALSAASPSPAPGARGASDDPTRHLEALRDEFLAWRSARAPYAARRGDRRGLLAPALSGATLDRERAWLREFRSRLAAVPHDERPGEPAAARALLDAAVEREGVELELLQPYRRDPGAYATLVALSVEAVFRDPGGSACARVRRAARRLAETPEVLRAARLNLTAPPRALVTLGIERCAAALRFCREDVPRLAAECRSPRAQADLAVADTIAVRAIESFRLYLEQDLLPTARGEPGIGADACRRVLQASLLGEVDPLEAVLEEARRRVDARRAEVDSLSRAVSEAGLPAALDSLSSAGPGDGVPPATVAPSLARVRGFLLARRVVSLPVETDLRVRSAGSFRDGPRISLAAGGSRDGRAPAWLEVAWSAAGGHGGPERGGRWATDLAAAREGLPGRYLRMLALRGTQARLRASLQESWSGDDWGQYCERMLLEEGYGAADPRYRLAGAVLALREAGRSLAALAFHSGEMTLDEARATLEERCLLDPPEADREVRRVVAEPALMASALGAERLLEIRDEVRQRLGAGFEARAFHDAVLRFGASPPGTVATLLRYEMTGEPGTEASRAER